MSQKPSSKLIAKALPKGDRFTGQFSLPGLIPDLVRGRDGNVQFFDTEQQAYVAAMEAVIRLYDSRTIDTRKAGGYRRLTGAELAVLLDEVDITPTYFAEIVGVPQHRVMKWLDGEQDIPHSAHVLVKLMKLNDDNFRVAEEITEEYRESS
ncbi:hypothetical protein DEA98_10145 [Brucella pseudogrignonensis]|uniref:Uncharacterized protein n=1 Tax=Brucella pseudogrignonensis TaxID=419475 RepID=A0A7Y3WY61_9HYPH|nr:hypothetical protein [Brucella pseudogrignonensis]MCM0751557.1 hypothetical protein [Brucella pseudogrignonensis]NNV22047.1 hypothetical protein [Brucella pseudogrignonensis]